MNNGMPECPVEIVMTFLKDRIGVLIIGYLLQEPQNPIQLQQKISSISLPILIKRIKDMEAWEIIESKDTVIAETSTIRLTAFGKSFDTILKEMECWGTRHSVHESGNGY